MSSIPLMSSVADNPESAADGVASAAVDASSSSSIPILSWSSFIPRDAQPFQTEASLAKALAALAATTGESLTSAAFAAEVDRLDPLAPFRAEFLVPRARDIGAAILGHGRTKEQQQAMLPKEVAETQDAVYLCGNSLGLLPRRAQTYVQDELSKWALLGVEGHFAGARPWARIDEAPTSLSMSIVGARVESEVAICNSLSANLHLLLTSFYRPSSTRFRILMEEAAFCSDHHVVRSQVELHGLKADEAIVALKAREGESWLRTEDIVAAINREKDSLALVLLPGIQFYTGQLFDMEAITRAAHHVGAYAGFDLAHAVGNVPLRLHEWQVDFAAWCSYKYLNSGPGAIGGLFVHESHHAQLSEDGGGPDAHERENASVERSAGAAAAAVTLHANLKSVASLPKLRGWWGQTPSQRFKMQSVHVEKPGAQSYMLSNPAVLPTVCMQASLELFALADPIKLRSKSMMLTAYLEHLMRTIIGATSSEDHAESVAAGAAAAAPAASSVSAVASKSSSVHVRILTPRNPCARGAQLSLLFSTPVRSIHHALSLWGIVTDVREPDVLRVSPTPLYNTFRDVFLFVDRLKHVLAEINAQHSK